MEFNFIAASTISPKLFQNELSSEPPYSEKNHHNYDCDDNKTFGIKIIILCRSLLNNA